MTNSKIASLHAPEARYVHTRSAFATRALGVALILATIAFFVVTAAVVELQCGEERCTIRRAAVLGIGGEDTVELRRIVLAESNWAQQRTTEGVTSSSNPALRLDDDTVVPLWPRRMSPVFHRFDATDITSWAAGNRPSPPRGTDVLISLGTLLGMGVMGFIGAILLWVAGAVRFQVTEHSVELERRGFIDPLRLNLSHDQLSGFGTGGEADAPHLFVCDAVGAWYYVTSDKVVVRGLGDALRALGVAETSLTQAKMTTTRNVSRSLGWMVAIQAISALVVLACCALYVMIAIP